MIVIMMMVIDDWIGHDENDDEKVIPEMIFTVMTMNSMQLSCAQGKG